MLGIREAVPADAPAIANMYIRAWRAAYRGLLDDDYLDALDAGEQAEKMCDRDSGSLILAQDYPQFAAYIALDQGRVLGWCFSGPASDNDHAPSGEIYALYVDPDNLRKGLGRQLFNEAARHLQAEAFETVYADALAGNTIADTFYTRINGRRFTDIADRNIGGAQVQCQRYYWQLVGPS